MVSVCVAGCFRVTSDARLGVIVVEERIAVVRLLGLRVDRPARLLILPIAPVGSFPRSVRLIIFGGMRAGLIPVSWCRQGRSAQLHYVSVQLRGI